MALQTQNFLGFGIHKPDFSGISDLFKNYYQGYEQAQTPYKLEQERIARELQNRLSHEQIEQIGIQNQYLPQTLQEQIALSRAHRGLYGAQTEAAKAPKHGDFVKAILDAEEVKRLYPNNPELHELADSYVRRKAEGAAGTEFMIDPATGAVSFSQGGSRSKGGPKIVTDAYGNTIQAPTSQTINATQESQIAEHKRDLLAQNVNNPYLGFGGSVELANDLRTYVDKKTTPEEKSLARERLIQAGLAFKLTPEVVSAQLNSQGVKDTIAIRKHQEEAVKQGFPIFFDKGMQLLPKDIQGEVNEKHDKLLKEINQSTRDFSLRGLPSKMGAPKNAQNITMDKIKYTAEKHKMSIEQVKQKAAKLYGISVEELNQLLGESNG